MFANRDQEAFPSTIPSSRAPPYWAASCTHQECSLHQLSPYIGKLKSVIARDLILTYSKPGDLVADMFCGSGTVPLEAASLGRRVFASDASTYAITLTKGKLTAPDSVASALHSIDAAVADARDLPLPDLRSTPAWVRSFFHPRTLENTLRVAHVLRSDNNHFLLGALLGILHHQRPGFLSHPSSHLVPYLRTKRFPRADFPELYEYRPLAPRLRAKVERSLRRPPSQAITPLITNVVKSDAAAVHLPLQTDCVITSPPYMNALDYCRDNRLRLWFLGESCDGQMDRTFATVPDFAQLIRSIAEELTQKVRLGGYCIFIVGDKTLRGGRAYPSEVLHESFHVHAPCFALERIITDKIPHVRRSRRNAAGVTQENILVFRKTTHAPLHS